MSVMAYLSLFFLSRWPPLVFLLWEASEGMGSGVGSLTGWGFSNFTIFFKTSTRRHIPMFPDGSPLIESSRAAGVDFEAKWLQGRACRDGGEAWNTPVCSINPQYPWEVEKILQGTFSWNQEAEHHKRSCWLILWDCREWSWAWQQKQSQQQQKDWMQQLPFLLLQNLGSFESRVKARCHASMIFGRTWSGSGLQIVVEAIAEITTI